MFLLLPLSIAVVALEMVAGYVLAFANAVMPGVAATDDRTFVAATQRVIASVANPLFLAVPNIAPLALLVAIVAALVSSAEAIVPTLVIASFLFYAATLVLTFAVALPMNNTLINRGNVMDPAELTRARAAFEGPWRRMNTLRTWTSTTAAVTATAALALAAI